MQYVNGSINIILLNVTCGTEMNITICIVLSYMFLFYLQIQGWEGVVTLYPCHIYRTLLQSLNLASLLPLV